MPLDDQAIIRFDKALRTVFAPAQAVRPMPGHDLPEADLSAAQRRKVAALMRVNHAGEVCAQALYQGQTIGSRNGTVRRELEEAAREETEHLAWTAQRIAELGGRTSALNPVWFAGALAIGTLAGRLGDAWSLGFLAETERQVEAHLDRHLDQVPVDDGRTRAVLVQMRADEHAHAEKALGLGARALPRPVGVAMKWMARVMTHTAYRL